ncbi:Uncharacterised protein [Leminorella richardii]|uniref:Uncharacterized protein n=1 Tax=Leminorella richardii TaxID=158841 RepID=A0A2X4V7H2_9GAMM|nr:DUF4286 family protein [Leminorella richardii]SQI44128.1 Uncharacterised protein [Leminorella richardii]
MNKTPTDDELDSVLLVELPGIRWTADDAQAARNRVITIPLDIVTAVDREETWVYAAIGNSARQGEIALSEETLIRGLIGGTPNQHTPVRIRSLLRINALGSAELGLAQKWHYVAETDILDHAEHEFNQWFDKEHLPLLAAIPGTQQARRYKSNGSPRYFTCYDLETRETHGNAQWRAAASTPWRNKMHESFLNSRRTMFTRI